MVLLGGEKAFVIGRVGEFNFDDPAFAVGVFVDDRWVVSFVLIQFAVELDDFTGQRQEEITGSFYRFNCSENFVPVQFFAYGFHLNVHEFIECLLSEVGDANRGDVAFNQHPFVLLGVKKICWYVHIKGIREVRKGKGIKENVIGSEE